VLRQDGFDLLWGYLGAKAFDDLPLVAHQELREVPADVLVAFVIGVSGFQESVQVTRTVTVHLDLGEHGERGVELGPGKFLDFLIGSGLLATELVAGKGQNAEARLVIVFVQGTQTCVLGSEASFARDVDDQADLALVLGEGNFLAVNGGHLEIVHAGHVVLLEWFVEI
jgi:hypothetical protein